jgi:hypothetical protein
MKTLRLVMAGVLAAALAACGGQAKQSTGGVQVSITQASSMSWEVPNAAAKIKAVYLIGTCTDYSDGCSDLYFFYSAPTFPLVETQRALKTGWSYDFTATAYDSTTDFSAEHVLFFGSAPFVVEEDQVKTLRIVMQQVVTPGSVTVAAPFISSIEISDTSPSIGQLLTFKAQVKDLDGTETAQWTSSCNGSSSLGLDVFSEQQVVANATELSLDTRFTSWCVGTEIIKLSVTAPATDATMGKSLVSTVQFTLNYDPQGIIADIGYNSWPDILGIGVIGNAQLQPGDTVQLDVSARDADGDDLVYTWIADCGEGRFYVFSSQLVQSPTFTAPSTPGLCLIEVCVSDVSLVDGVETLRGGYNDATLTLNIGTSGLPVP